MNERIRELAHEVGLPTYNPGDGIPTKLEKFADRIVQECADIALREDHEPSECILNHFGVKR